MSGLRGLWQRALTPERGFRERAAEDLGLSASLRGLLLLRAPVACLELTLTYAGFARMYGALASAQGAVWDLVLGRLGEGLGVQDIRALLQGLPPLPALGSVLPWLLLAAPLYVLSLWLHDALWDHGCLWLLGGLKGRHGFRATLIADSEALQVGVFGALLGLLSDLPRVGWLLALPLGLVGAYFWILRGFALAAFHRCPTWKGVLATVLHGVLAVGFVLGTALLLVLLVVL